MPVGLSFIGPKWSDGLILSLGYAYEQARGPFPTPRFLPSIESSPEIAPRVAAGQAVSRSPAIAATMTKISRIRIKVPGSSKKAMPTSTVPTAPMPPHTA